MRQADSFALVASGALTAYSIVKSDGSGGVVLAAAATDKLLGVTTDVATASGQTADIQVDGIVPLQLGGTVAAGDLITSNASGLGVVPAPAAGSNNRVVGMALDAGVSGDVIRVDLSLGSIQG